MKARRSGSFRCYKSVADRKRAVAQLLRAGYNYFVGYIESGEPGYPAGLMLGKVTWTKLYISDCHRLVH